VQSAECGVQSAVQINVRETGMCRAPISRSGIQGCVLIGFVAQSRTLYARLSTTRFALPVDRSMAPGSQMTTVAETPM
jgi:hypothetical protein